MAHVFPSEPVSYVSDDVARIHRLIKRLPDAYVAWFGLHTQVGQPHFLILRENKRGYMVQVSSATEEKARGELDPSQYGQGELPIGLEEGFVLEEFAGEVARSLELPADEPLAVSRLILYPNVASETIAALMEARGGDPSNTHVGTAHWNEAHLQALLEQEARPGLTKEAVNVLRKRMAPEVTIPAEYQPHKIRNRWKDKELAESFLDFDQEDALKADLQIEAPSEEENVVEARLISGLAGSGKSTVLLGRALVMADLHPEAQMLVLTHNRPLLCELRRRFERVAGPNRPIIWQTFLHWALSYFDPQPVLLSERERKELAIPLKPKNINLSIEFLLDEVDWLREQRITRFGEYMIANRAGRSVGLSANQRESVWDFHRAYGSLCGEQGVIDWSLLVLHFWNMVRKKQLDLPQFDAIFIDEAQFFAPTWFDCVKASLRADGQLFLSADPTQGFMRRRLSWTSVGVEVRGRSTRLRRPYRNSRAILHFADQFYRSRLGEEGMEEIDLPDAATIESAPSAGVSPRILYAPNAEKTLERVYKEIQRLVDRGCAYGQILVLHEVISPLEQLGEMINAEYGRGRAVVLQDQMIDERVLVRLCTLEWATGLEAPVIFLLGLDELFEAEADPNLTDEERNVMIRDHTRKLYMAFTRAGYRLIIVLRNRESLRQFAETDVIMPQLEEPEDDAVPTAAG